MLKKILIIVAIFLVLGGIGLIFKNNIKNLFSGNTPDFKQIDIKGEPSADYQMAVVYSYSPVSQIQELNAHSVRTQIAWDSIEKTQGKYDWHGLDSTVEQAQKAKISLSLIIYTGRGWGTKCDPKIAPLNNKTHCPPSDLTDSWNDQYGYSKNYYSFVNTVAKRYQGRIDEYIIHNEVNTLRFWHGTADQYLKLRKTAYKAVHDADSQAIVIDNSMASAVWGAVIVKDLLDQDKEQEAVDFYNNFFSRGEKFTKVSNKEEIIQAASRRQEWDRAIEFGHAIFKEPTFDWIGFHYYEPEDTFLSVIDWIQSEMQKNGYQKPIAMTEGGYADARSGINESQNEQEVSEDLVKMQIEGFANGLRMFAWLPIQEGILQGDFNAKLKGLFDQSGKILPAGKAWSYLNSLIVKGAKITDLSKNNLNLYLIENRGRKIYVVWSQNSSTTIEPQDINQGSFNMIDIFGQTKAENLKSTQINSTPVYLE